MGQFIRSAGVKLLLLLKYSPDLKPIEQVFVKLEHLPRKAAARTLDAVAAAVGQLLKGLHTAGMRQHRGLEPRGGWGGVFLAARNHPGWSAPSGTMVVLDNGWIAALPTAPRLNKRQR